MSAMDYLLTYLYRVIRIDNLPNTDRVFLVIESYGKLFKNIADSHLYGHLNSNDGHLNLDVFGSPWEVKGKALSSIQPLPGGHPP